MSKPLQISVRSSLDAPQDIVWDRISTMSGVNDELRPFIRMTSPREHEVLPTEVDGDLLFTSWLLLFGVVPFDRHALALERVDAGVGFVEESTSWLQRRWRHERTLSTTDEGGCAIEDRLVIEPRLRFVGPLMSAVVGQLFAHRHRRLAKRFGNALASSTG